MRISVSDFQFSPRIESGGGSASKVFTTFVDISVSRLHDLPSWSVDIHIVKLNHIQFC